MTNEAKAREFWIYRNKKRGGIIEVRQYGRSPIAYDPSEDEEVHVIEASALEALKLELEVKQQAITHHMRVNVDLESQNASLKAELEMALKITDNNTRVCSEEMDRKDKEIASLREALDVALRQWEHYITDRDRDDIENIHHDEARLYKKQRQALKGEK